MIFSLRRSWLRCHNLLNIACTILESLMLVMFFKPRQRNILLSSEIFCFLERKFLQPREETKIKLFEKKSLKAFFFSKNNL